MALYFATLLMLIRSLVQHAACAMLGVFLVFGNARACGPGTTGEPCAAAVGNPINVITGNKYQRETDMPALPGVLGLEIVRHYNSDLSNPRSANGILGRGWKLGYETDLYAIGNTLQIMQADGTRIIFSRDFLETSLCSSANPAHGSLIIIRSSRGDEYEWKQIDGKKLSFNHQGKLVQIMAPTGEFVSMQHDHKGLLVSVTDPQGRRLHLDYPGLKENMSGERFRGVQSIDSPVGRFIYSHGSEAPEGASIADRRKLIANLVKVSMSVGDGAAQKIEKGNISRIYHYEDARRPTLLTGISIIDAGTSGKQASQRLSTFGYDINGKAVLSSHAGGVDKVTLDTSVGGQTILSNSLGQKTVYRHAIVGGEFRLLEVRGAGCALCGDANVRYAYDNLGRLTGTTRLN